MQDDNDAFPFDMTKLLKQFTNNVSISRDDEGVIITFKNLAPGTDLRMVKEMMENAMRSNNSEMMRRFMGAFTGEEEDEFDEDDEDAFEEDPTGHDEEENDDQGFRIDDLEDGNGFKLVPDDPDDIDDLLESMSQMFDPEFFETMMRAVSQLFGVRPQVDEDPGDETSRNKKRRDGDSNTTAGYFYI